MGNDIIIALVEVRKSIFNRLLNQAGERPETTTYDPDLRVKIIRLQKEVLVIVAIVTFKLKKNWSVSQASEVFTSTAPRYLNKPGLIRKHYFITESGDRSGGIYLWKSKADAAACYTPEWKAMVTEKYGEAPDILYLEVPVTVDNIRQVIETGP